MSQASRGSPGPCNFRSDISLHQVLKYGEAPLIAAMAVLAFPPTPEVGAFPAPRCFRVICPFLRRLCEGRAAMSPPPRILSTLLFGGLALSAALETPVCKLSFDGRVPLDATAEQFSTPQSLFNPTHVIGPNVTWAEIIEFPDLPPSRVSLATP